MTPPMDLPNAGIRPTSPLSPALQVGSLPYEPPQKPIKYHRHPLHVESKICVTSKIRHKSTDWFQIEKGV